MVLTRSGDLSVPLANRVAIANGSKADLFLSIHPNSMPTAETRQRAEGIETYFLSADATDAHATAVADRENADDRRRGRPRSRRPGGLHPLRPGGRRRLSDSSRLAYCLHQRLVAVTGAADRGVKQAPFYVLAGARMPAVLIEVGFISHAVGRCAARHPPVPGAARGRDRRGGAGVPPGDSSGAEVDTAPASRVARAAHPLRGARPVVQERHPVFPPAMRTNGRAGATCGPILLKPGVSQHAEGSCLVEFGDTHVLCTGSVEDRVPPHVFGNGQPAGSRRSTACCPRATHSRIAARGRATGKQGGRTQEIQRLIGPVAARGGGPARARGRAPSPWTATSSRRTAARAPPSITGAYVALVVALADAAAQKALAARCRCAPRSRRCRWASRAARWCLDLDYEEDSHGGRGPERRGHRDGRAGRGAGHRRGEALRARASWTRMLDAALAGIATLTQLQAAALRMSRSLLFATTNPGKLRELRRLVAGLPLQVLWPEDLGRPLPEVVEDGATFAGERREEGHRLRPVVGGATPWRTTPGSASTRSPGRLAFARRAGRTSSLQPPCPARSATWPRAPPESWGRRRAGPRGTSGTTTGCCGSSRASPTSAGARSTRPSCAWPGRTARCGRASPAAAGAGIGRARRGTGGFGYDPLFRHRGGGPDHGRARPRRRRTPSPTAGEALRKLIPDPAPGRRAPLDAGPAVR